MSQQQRLLPSRDSCGIAVERAVCQMREEHRSGIAAGLANISWPFSGIAAGIGILRIIFSTHVANDGAKRIVAA